jgi:hypothetical protein
MVTYTGAVAKKLEGYLRTGGPALLLGLIAFVSITGGKIIRPQHVDWLMENDPSTHWLGWEFFRYTPLLQWPLGANPNYGMNIGSSIVFTDSIPLLALIFKPLNAFLPATFQYIGLWILTCFMLQSYFAWKLLACFTHDKWLPVIGSAFFTVAPIFLWRLHGHYALCGHWVLLAGLYFYFSKRFSILRWIGLLAATALIHAYLLLMVIAIWGVDLWQRSWQKEMSVERAIAYVLAGGACTTIIMWAVGYFMVGGGFGSGGFGYFRMNLLSLIDSDNAWSRLLPDQKQGSGDYEGFNYLGSGILGLALVAGYELLRNGKVRYGSRIVPVLVLSIGLFIYAVSNHVGLGAHELFSYKWPPITDQFTSMFRVSGRLFWPAYYLIYVAILYVIFMGLKRNEAAIVCLGLLCIQIIDSSTALNGFRNKFTHPPEWSSPMQSPLWHDMARRYKNIIFVLPYNDPPSWMPLAHFSAMNRMAINIGYFARVNPVNESNARVDVANVVLHNKFSPDSLYVFENDGLWGVALSQVMPPDVAGIIDGFRVVAPKLGNCSTCSQDEIPRIAVQDQRKFDDRRNRISFSRNGMGQKHVVYGWSKPEEWGTWSDGNAAAVLVDLPVVPKRDLELLIEGRAFLHALHPTQQIEVAVNDHVLIELKYDSRSPGIQVVKIPRSIAIEKGSWFLIQFRFKNAKSPAQLGLSSDSRNLGLGLVSLQLKSVED